LKLLAALGETYPPWRRTLHFCIFSEGQRQSVPPYRETGNARPPSWSQWTIGVVAAAAIRRSSTATTDLAKLRLNRHSAHAAVGLTATNIDHVSGDSRRQTPVN